MDSLQSMRTSDAGTAAADCCELASNIVNPVSALSYADVAGVLPAAYGQLFLGVLLVLAHCTGMCGPLMLSFRFGLRRAQASGGRRLAAAQLGVYQLGRMFWYAAFGAVAGGIGQIAGGSVAQQYTAGTNLLSPLLALGLIGLVVLHWRGRRAAPGTSGGGLAAACACRLRRLGESRPLLAAFGLGNAMAFLPCMVTAWCLLLAASTASMLHGAILMMLLVVLTTPALAPFALLHTCLPRLSGRWRGRLQLACLLLSAGWMSLIALAANEVVPHAHLQVGELTFMFF